MSHPINLGHRRERVFAPGLGHDQTASTGRGIRRRLFRFSEEREIRAGTRAHDDQD